MTDKIGRNQMLEYEDEGIVICSCGHGKPHHIGKFGNCTCDIGFWKNQKLCDCQWLNVVKIIHKGNITLKEKRNDRLG